MTPSPTIQPLCQELIEQLTNPEILTIHGLSITTLADHIVSIVTRNQMLNRVTRVTRVTQYSSAQLPGDETILAAYITGVVKIYLQEHQRIEQLGNGHEEAWVTVINILMPRAVYALQRGLPTGTNVTSEAVELVQDACAIIYSNAFPYDVPFVAWVLKILNNLVLKKFTRSRDLIDRRPAVITSFDHPRQLDPDGSASLYDFVADESGEIPFEQIEQHEWLISAIESLRSQPQQQVIVLSYFHHLSDDEIAAVLAKSKNAVQILRHRALQKLKIILEADVKETDSKLH
jgi:RNA polymerase sigma factor (sigma-70 family)